MDGFVKQIQGLAASVYQGNVQAAAVIVLPAFRLHHPLTVGILCVLTLLATMQLAGKAIQCTVDPAIPEPVMNTYCWIHSTYTLPDLRDGKVGLTVVSPGVGSMRTENEPIVYHKYYQWVVFFMLFLAMLSYVPYYIWTVLENGRIKMLLIAGEKTKKEDLDLKAVTAFLSKNLANHNNYYRVYIACEVLNLIVVLFEMYLINVFLGYEFTTYGFEVLQFIDQDSNRSDPMDAIFPKVTKCTFRKFGPSGNIIPFDGLCVLSMNIFHEKTFIFLWFWLWIVLILTAIGIIWNIACLCSHSYRSYLLRKKVLNFGRHPDQRNDPRFDPIIRLPTPGNPKFEAIETIMNRLDPGDWFVLYQLSRNMWPHHFAQLIRELALAFKWKEPKSE